MRSILTIPMYHRDVGPYLWVSSTSKLASRVCAVIGLSYHNIHCLLADHSSEHHRGTPQ